MKAAVERHDEILRQTIEGHAGLVFRTMGDAFCAVFSVAPQALDAAAAIQRALYAEPWNEQISPIRVRVALHTGIGEVRDGDYVGQALNRVARLLSLCHGGQTLLSRPTRDLVGDALPPTVTLRDLGEHSLKDLQRSEFVFQVVIEGLPADFPSLNSSRNRPNNLPAPTSLFVGRGKEIAALCSLLRRSDVRLLTLTGPGGTGKTRLALQVATELTSKDLPADEFHDGAFFIDLAPISDPNLVIPTIAQTLDLKEAGGQTLSDSLRVFLREKHILLVLDNFEQLMEAARSIGQLLAVNARLKMMITSQVVLHLNGEQEFVVSPLSLPDPSLFSGQALKQSLPVDTLSQYEAVNLFVQRARLAKPDFEITEQDAPIIVEICHRLDGLPLAIELAAARIKLLPPKAMHARLAGLAGGQGSLKLLVGGARDLPARQQALRSTIEWSYELLGEEEKTLFRRLSVFAGGCTLEAAEAVCETDVLEGIATLIDRSLLRSAEGRDTQSIGNTDVPRLSMLETIREYARERLEEAGGANSGEALATRRRHARFYLALAEAERGEYQAPAPGHSIWLEKAEAEQDNMRAALQWSLEQDEADTALRLAGALSHFWQMRGNISEGRRWAESALALPGAKQHGAAYARVLIGTGTIGWFQGDLVAARSRSEESAAIFRELGDQRGHALSLLLLGQSTLFLGDAAGAVALLDEGLALYRQIGVKWGIAQALFSSGQARTFQGDFGAARSLLEESLALYRQSGNDWWAAQALNSLGDVARMHADYVSAQTLYEQSLGIFRRLRAKTELPASQHNLGHLAIIRGDLELATALFEESLILHRESLNEAGIIESLAGFAGVAAAQRQPERAARLFGASDALHVAISAPTWPAERMAYERNLAIARAQMDEGAWSAAWEEGRGMSMEEATDYAVQRSTAPKLPAGC
jgi:predicted ATPase